MLRGDPQHTTKPKSLKDELQFHFFVELYRKMNRERDLNKLKAVGGVRELAYAFEVDLNYGIDTTPQGQERFSLEDREEIFGKNTFSAFKPRASFSWTGALLKNVSLIPLIFAAMATMILGLSFKEERENLTWINGIGIWALVLIIFMTSVAHDYQLFLNRVEMNREKDIFDVTVLRDGKEQLIKSSDLLVGDILVLTRDAPVAADGLLFVGDDLFINEEIITGESRPIKKTVVENPFCYAGTRVTNGSGKIFVTSVGEESELGQMTKTVAESADDADKKAKITDIFSKRNLQALCLGVLSFIVLLIRWMTRKKNRLTFLNISDERPVKSLILAIGVIVFEFQAGYFLYDTFCRLYLVWKLAKDKIQVRTSDAFGSMSDVTHICFDKTGTITENMMVVVKGFFQGTYFDRVPNIEELDPMTLELIMENASLNSEAYMNVEEDGSIKFVGNQTECALLVLAKKLGIDYSKIRLHKSLQIIKNYGFNSDKKMSSVIVKHGDLLRLYNKGAAEMVLNKCKKYVDRSGSRNLISVAKRVELENVIETMDKEGLRSLALTYVELDVNNFNFGENGEPLEESEGDKRGFAEPPEEDLTLLDIIGINDPIREGASELVEQFKNAGIFPRMVTGDNLDTASHIAVRCGILTDGFAMNGPEFRRRYDGDIDGLKKDLPKLQVLARCSPSDKQKLVTLLQEEDEKVAVTGDGTNDVRALKEATVGIAMGTSSTEVARDAADVVIMNDNILSILTFYLWSRRFALSRCGYTRFRSSVTLVVWIILLLSTCVVGETPLNACQFLWANFIIDTLVALIFATESPPSGVPNDGSYGTKREPMKDASHRWHVRLLSLYQIIVIICTYYPLSRLFERKHHGLCNEHYCDYWYHRCQSYKCDYDGHYCDGDYRDGDCCDGEFCVKYHCDWDCCDSDRCDWDRFSWYRCDWYRYDWDSSYFYKRLCVDFPLINFKMRVWSLMFNVFIFMQLFNSLNCRKLLNEYNIFEGLFNSPLSLSIRVVIIGLQLLIMLTPVVRSLFKMDKLLALEWLYSIVVSVVVIPLSTLIRFILRAIGRR